MRNIQTQLQEILSAISRVRNRIDQNDDNSAKFSLFIRLHKAEAAVINRFSDRKNKDFALRRSIEYLECNEGQDVLEELKKTYEELGILNDVYKIAGVF